MNSDAVCPHCGAKVPLAEDGTCEACGKAVAARDPFFPPGSDATPPDEPRRLSKWPFILGILAVMLLLFVFGFVRPLIKAMKDAGCNSYLKQLGSALHNFHDARKHFPAPYTVDENGRRLHSWRVYMLPYMEKNDLYKKIRLDEPWNSPYNRQFASQMPQGFRCPANPNQDATDGITDYLMITGPGTVGDGPKGVSIKDISDGSSNTIIVIEVANSGINWMCPRDYDIAAAGWTNGPEEKKPSDSKGRPMLSSYHTERVQAAFVDGNVKGLRKDIDPELLKGLFTINGGEDLLEIHK